MSGYAVRQKFLRRFAELGAYSRPTAIFIVSSYVLQILIAIGLGYRLLQAPLGLVSGACLVLLMLFIGTRLRGLNNIVHECSHASFAERRGDNLVIGRLCAALALGSFAEYRAEHMTHHAHVGNYDKDLDLKGIRDFRLEDPLTPRTVLRHLLTPVLGLHLPYYVRINLTARDGTGFLVLKFALIAAAVVFLILDPVPALVLVWLPFLWVRTAINYWTDCADHAGLVGAGDDLDTSRNVPLPAPLRLFLFPRNDSYHLVHHLFPQVPARHLGNCHKNLLSDPVYRARTLAGPSAEALPQATATVAGDGQGKPDAAAEARPRSRDGGSPRHGIAQNAGSGA